MTCPRCGLARPEPYGVFWRCGCCGLLFVPTFPPENRGVEGERVSRPQELSGGLERG